MIKRSKGEIIFEIFNIIFLAVVAIICLYPMLYVLLASFSKPSELMSHSGLLIKPLGFYTEAYKEVFARESIWVAYGNTFIYVIAGTIISLILTATFAYVLSRKGLYWNKALSIFALITMYFGGGMIPTFLNVIDLGLYNTRWAILLPTALSTYNMIIMRSGFAAVPTALEEAAEIDGASPFRTFVSIVLPLALPTVAVIALYYAVAQWNAWFNAAIYLMDTDLLPLQLFLRKILQDTNISEFTAGGGVASGDTLMLAEVIKYAVIIVSVVPILLLYPFIQKYFTKGVMVGAVKE
ncbi:MAG: carbohydrate ABC transporter permease [Ruminococcaceae bacterium]|nr:carbohydrate ABC transporter permease [Oscillospiraceae bacterium]